MTRIKSIIKKKLKAYKIPLNEPNFDLPEKLAASKKVAIVGGGIAGMVSALELSEKGFDVTLFEKNSYWGGKLGSWTFESKGEILRATHGFHAFFNQYYNLLRFMEKIGVDQYLKPIEDYQVLFSKDEAMSFKGIENTPGLNILDLRKKGVFHVYTFFNLFSIPFLDLLRYHPEKTFKRYDNISYASFAKWTMMPKKMRIVFNSFARAFFSEPGKMSMAELIKSFHFYFLSNDAGLLYQTLDDDFEYTFLQPLLGKLKQNGVDLRLNTAVESLNKTDSFEINNEVFDYTILALDVKGLKSLVSVSNGLASTDFARLSTMKLGDYYAVYRVWTNAFEEKEMPYFVITDKKRALDSITFYHRTEKESEQWSVQNGGGIFELHSYSLPGDLKDEMEIKKVLLDEFFEYCPELKNMEIRHEYFQYKNDFPAFHVGEYLKRPKIETDTAGMYLAGDWVKMENPTMLMEAACTSGILAANYICRENGVRETQLFTVPEKGLLA